MLTVTDLAVLLGRTPKEIVGMVGANFKEAKKLKADSLLDERWIHFAVRQSGRSWPKFKVVTIAALKGGVGKTTLSLNMAKLAALLGLKVLVVDFDPEACATNALRSEAEEEMGEMPVLCDVIREGLSLDVAIRPSNISGIDLVPSALRNHHLEKLVGNQNPKKIVRALLESQKSYNLILLDLPPAFSTVTGSAYLASDLIILPCTPNIFSLESVALTIEAIDRMADEFDCGGIEYKIVMNQYNQQRVAAREVYALLDEKYKSQLCSAPIRESADVVNATNSGSTIYDVRINQAVRDSFTALGATVLGW